jgi:hypothetical protein
MNEKEIIPLSIIATLCLLGLGVYYSKNNVETSSTNKQNTTKIPEVSVERPLPKGRIFSFSKHMSSGSGSGSKKHKKQNK